MPKTTPAGEIWEIIREIARNRVKEQEARAEEREKMTKLRDEIAKERAKNEKKLWTIEEKAAKARKEADEARKETERQFKKTDKRIAELNELFTGQWGKLMEALVDGDLVALLQGQGIDVKGTRNSLKGDFEGERCEFDIVAVNGEEVVVVEVKTTLQVRDVNRFVSRSLKYFTKICQEYEGQTIYGAVAFLKGHESVVSHAVKQGLFVIRATGSSASIVNSKGFMPKKF